MCQSLPKFINEIVDNTFLTFQVEEYGSFDYGTATTRITCASFPEIKTTVNKVLLRYIDNGDPLAVARSLLDRHRKLPKPAVPGSREPCSEHPQKKAGH